MKMIAQETLRVNLPFRLAARLSERSQKPLAILIIMKNVLALISAIHHRIHRARIVYPQRPRHEQTGYSTGLPVSIVTLACMVKALAQCTSL